MTRDWLSVIATFDARQLLLARMHEVDGPGYLRLIGALAFLFRSEGRVK